VLFGRRDKTGWEVPEEKEGGRWAGRRCTEFIEMRRTVKEENN
jgi:hypothetical protein